MAAAWTARLARTLRSRSHSWQQQLMNLHALASCIVSLAGFATGCVAATRDPSSACATPSALLGASAQPDLRRLERSEQLAIGSISAVSDFADPRAFCTATMISANWLLTARHCTRPGSLVFKLGPDRSAPLAEAEIEEVLRHPRFDLSLARIEASGGGEAWADVAPVSVRAEPLGHEHIGLTAQLAGLGRTESGGAGVLGFVSEPIVAVEPNAIVVDGMGHTGACDGDSGGPLFLQSDDERVRLAGVLSIGEANCAGKDLYVRVDAVRDWIQANVGELDPSCAD